MATIAEKKGSPRITSGSSPSIEREYVVWGTNSESAVLAFVRITVPIWDASAGPILVRGDITIQPQGRALDVWDVTVPYQKSKKPDIGLVKYTFSTGGGSGKITQSIATIARYAAPGETAEDHQGAIGVTPDSVEGTDVPLPEFSFTETWKMPIASMTWSYQVTLAYLTTCWNVYSFRGFAPGEVQFVNADGAVERQDDQETAINPEVTFSFKASPNRAGLVCGEIEGITKRGWDYLWFQYAEEPGDKRMKKRPIAAYVEQVLYSGDFAAIGIG